MAKTPPNTTTEAMPATADQPAVAAESAPQPTINHNPADYGRRRVPVGGEQAVSADQAKE